MPFVFEHKICHIDLLPLRSTYTLVQSQNQRKNTIINRVIHFDAKKHSHLDIPMLCVDWVFDNDSKKYVAAVFPSIMHADSSYTHIKMDSDEAITLSFQSNATFKMHDKSIIYMNSKFFAPIIKIKFTDKTKPIITLPQRELFDRMLLGGWDLNHIHATTINCNLRLSWHENQDRPMKFLEEKMDLLDQMNGLLGPNDIMTQDEFDRLFKGNKEVQKEFHRIKMEEIKKHQNDTENEDGYADEDMEEVGNDDYPTDSE